MHYEYGPNEWRHGCGLPVDKAALQAELSKGTPKTTPTESTREKEAR